MAPVSRLRVALVWHGELMADHLATDASPITVGTRAGATFVVPVTHVPDGFAVIRPFEGGWVLAKDGGAQLVPIRAGDNGIIPVADGIELFYQFVLDDTRLPRRRSNWELLTPALAFALLLHAVMLFATYVFDENIDPFTYPGSRRVIGEFLVQRVKAPPEPETAIPDERTRPATATAPRAGGETTKGGGNQGGEPEAGTPTAPPRGLYTPRNRVVIDGVIGHDMTPSLGKFMGLPGPRRHPGAPGIGDDPPGGTRPGPRIGIDGPRGPDKPLDVGPIRDRKPTSDRGPVEVEMSTLPPTTDNPQLTHKEINDVVQSRAGLIRACYQRGADLKQGLGGTLTVRFTIGADGHVTDSKIDANKSDLRDAGVEGCVLRQINRLVFPAKGGGHVNYPFRFAQK